VKSVVTLTNHANSTITNPIAACRLVPHRNSEYTRTTTNAPAYREKGSPAAKTDARSTTTNAPNRAPPWQAGEFAATAS
jgi:hypothetical protein